MVMKALLLKLYCPSLRKWLRVTKIRTVTMTGTMRLMTT
jgi:hypothetical protein